MKILFNKNKLHSKMNLMKQKNINKFLIYKKINLNSLNKYNNKLN